MVRNLVTLLTLFALCVVSLPAPAAGESAPATPEMIRNNEALGLITFPWHVLDYRIVFMEPKTGFRAMTYPKKHLIEIYARPGDDSLRLAHDIAHELGHAVDVTYNTPESRKRWMALRGIDPDTGWFACNKCSDFDTPAGDFAETFSLLQVGNEYFSGNIAPRPADKDIPSLIAFFSSLPKLPKDAFPAPRPRAADSNPEILAK